jgi:hypothetical protein
VEEEGGEEEAGVADEEDQEGWPGNTRKGELFRGRDGNLEEGKEGGKEGRREGGREGECLSRRRRKRRRVGQAMRGKVSSSEVAMAT